MTKKNGGLPSSLKHAVYSGMTLLPGEDADAFNKLHKELIAEFAPTGQIERDIVATMARLAWRKQNLATYRMAKLAQDRWNTIHSKFGARFNLDFALLKDTRTPEQIRADNEAGREEAKRELGAAMELVEVADVITTDHLLKELELNDRLDGMIDRCIKRLLMVRGLKSLSSGTSTAPSEPKRIAAA
jgi:hypothetical protein